MHVGSSCQLHLIWEKQREESQGNHKGLQSLTWDFHRLEDKGYGCRGRDCFWERPAVDQPVLSTLGHHTDRKLLHPQSGLLKSVAQTNVFYAAVLEPYSIVSNSGTIERCV